MTTVDLVSDPATLMPYHSIIRSVSTVAVGEETREEIESHEYTFHWKKTGER